jgi:hypothetical protein
LDALRGANLLIRFLTELAAVVGVAYGLQQAIGDVAGIVLGILAGFAAAMVWGIFVAPKARRRLDDPLRLGVEAVVFGAACLALALGGAAALAIAFAAIVVVSETLMFALGQRGM